MKNSILTVVIIAAALVLSSFTGQKHFDNEVRLYDTVLTWFNGRQYRFTCAEVTLKDIEVLLLEVDDRNIVQRRNVRVFNDSISASPLFNEAFNRIYEKIDVEKSTYKVLFAADAFNRFTGQATFKINAGKPGRYNSLSYTFIPSIAPLDSTSAALQVPAFTDSIYKQDLEERYGKTRKRKP